MEVRIKYIMVTDWPNHWDNLENNSAHFTNPGIKEGVEKDPWPDEAETLFIKHSNGKFEKSWYGISKNFR